MADLSLKDIEKKLNLSFQSDTRKIIFWYDERGEFQEDVKELHLHNGKIHHLTRTNVFKTKILLEIEDPTSNYLVYGAFKKPEMRENHLADMIKYSDELFVDRVSVIASQLKIDDALKPVLKKHINFFRARDREEKFYSLALTDFDEESIEVGMMSILTKSKSVDFTEVLSILLSRENLRDGENLKEFEKFDLADSFWKILGDRFGYHDESPSLEKFAYGLFLTYLYKYADGEFPSNLQSEVFQKPNNVVAFLDNMKNNRRFSKDFDTLSKKVFKNSAISEIINKLTIEDLAPLDIFKAIDFKIIDWIRLRLLEENTVIKVGNLNLVELCDERESRHFGDEFSHEYHLLKNAFRIISRKAVKFEAELVSIIENYDREDYKIDMAYRKFYFYYDKLEDKENFRELREKVENIYKNVYLDPLSVRFSSEFAKNESRAELSSHYKIQTDFYDRFVNTKKSKIVVIISDGMRYEVGKDLVEVLRRDKKFEDGITIEPLVGVFPSITSHGMAALLPHREIVLNEKLQAVVDGKPSGNVSERRKILQLANINSDAISYDELNKKNRDELREFFKEKEIIYIYHNQIDARGDSAFTEDEVFNACDEAVEEISSIMKKLTSVVSVTNYLITADHGFVYKRDKLEEHDKISHHGKEGRFNKRFIFSDEVESDVGVTDMIVSSPISSYGKILGKTPVGTNIFKAPGSGQNYYHGGISLQEIIIPVISVKTIRSAVADRAATIELNSTYSRISGLIFAMEFIQKEPISDVVIPTVYEIFVEDENGKKISDIHVHRADSVSADPLDRIFKVEFNLLQKSYNEREKYFLVLVDRESGSKRNLRELVIDIPFANNFGFDV